MSSPGTSFRASVCPLFNVYNSFIKLYCLSLKKLPLTFLQVTVKVLKSVCGNREVFRALLHELPRQGTMADTFPSFI